MSQLRTVCEESCIMMQFTPPEFYKQHAYKHIHIHIDDPVHIIVFCVVTSDGDMLPFIFPHGLRLGSLDQVPGEGSAFLD